MGLVLCNFSIFGLLCVCFGVLDLRSEPLWGCVVGFLISGFPRFCGCFGCLISVLMVSWGCSYWLDVVRCNDMVFRGGFV